MIRADFACCSRRLIGRARRQFHHISSPRRLPAATMPCRRHLCSFRANCGVRKWLIRVSCWRRFSQTNCSKCMSWEGGIGTSKCGPNLPSGRPRVSLYEDGSHERAAGVGRPAKHPGRRKGDFNMAYPPPARNDMLRRVNVEDPPPPRGPGENIKFRLITIRAYTHTHTYTHTRAY